MGDLLGVREGPQGGVQGLVLRPAVDLVDFDFAWRAVESRFRLARRLISAWRDQWVWRSGRSVMVVPCEGGLLGQRLARPNGPTD